MKKMYKKEEGVSPVIATILMVAITVVLATTVWLLVSGYMGGSTQTPLTMGLTYNAQQSTSTTAVFDVTMSHPSQANPSDVKVTIKVDGATPGSTSGGIGTTAQSVSVGSYTYDVSYVDLNGNGKLDTGDQIILTNSTSGATSISGITVYIYITGYSGNVQATVPS